MTDSAITKQLRLWATPKFISHFSHLGIRSNFSSCSRKTYQMIETAANPQSIST